MARKKQEESEPIETSITPGESALDVSFVPREQENLPSAYYPPDMVPDFVEESTLFLRGEDEQRVSFNLPRAVLFALIDPSFPAGDLQRAEAMGLSTDGKPTELGQRILNGTDSTALRHKMTAAYRAAQFEKNK